MLACHAIDQSPTRYDVKLERVSEPCFSVDDKLSSGQTAKTVNRYLYLQHENYQCRANKNKPIIFLLSFLLCKGKSITGGILYHVHLGDENQRIHPSSGARPHGPRTRIFLICSEMCHFQCRTVTTGPNRIRNRKLYFIIFI